MSEKTTMTGPARLRALADDANTQGFMWLSQDLRQLAALWEADLSYAAGLIADEILRAERAEAALDRATNDLMLSEESFVTMRAKRDEVLSELRTTRAALERERMELVSASVSVSRARELTLAQEIRANNLSAALERAQTQVALYEGRHPAQLGPDGREMSPRHRFGGDGICIRCGSDVDSDTGCVEELCAALERARALLEDIQWDGNSNGTLCPACNRFQLDGHRPGCELAALLTSASGGAA